MRCYTWRSLKLNEIQPSHRRARGSRMGQYAVSLEIGVSHAGEKDIIAPLLDETELQLDNPC